jgi:AraC family transcriptional regulator, positive regulator of tynA and feaB
MGARLDYERPGHWAAGGVERRALTYWADTVCDRFLELDTELPGRGQPRASDQLDFGPATLSFVGATSPQIRRTPARIAQARHPNPTFFLVQFRVGHGTLRQRGRDLHIRTGECALIDGTQPYDLECPQTLSAAILRMPDAWLRRWVPNPENASPTVLSQGDWSSALCAAMASLRPETCGDLALPRSAVAEQIASLLALAVGKAAAAESPRSLLHALIGTLCDRLEEADLSPLTVAAQHGISKRTLHYAFAAAGTTFVEQLMQLRLERAREILSDARQAAPRIEDVATRCGFTDPSHFARRFRQKYSHAPLQYRRAVL